MFRHNFEFLIVNFELKKEHNFRSVAKQAHFSNPNDWLYHVTTKEPGVRSQNSE